MKTFLAIDFGTSQTSVAILSEDSTLPPQIIELNDGQRAVKAIDTAIQLDDNGNITYFGAKAQEKANEAPERTFQNFKVAIGSKNDYQRETEQTQYAPEDLALLFLSHLREIIEEKHFNGVKLSEMDELSCVIGCPAEWTEVQKNALKDIALKAGFPGIKLCDEPVGAIYYNYFFGGLKLDKKKNILVYDFGGGTTDVAIAEVSISETGRIDSSILSVGGLTSLGGKDFDEALIKNYAKENGYDIQSLPPKDKIHDHWVIGLAARRVKEELSEKEATEKTINRLKSANDAKPKRISATRITFEAICKELIDRFDDPIYDALSSAGLSPEDIDYVILAGGSSAMPFVKNRMSEIFAVDKIIMSPSTDVIAQGLALYGRTDAVGTVIKPHDESDPKENANKSEQFTYFSSVDDANPIQRSSRKSNKVLFIAAAAIIMVVFIGFLYMQNKAAQERAAMQAQLEQARIAQARAEREKAEAEQAKWRAQVQSQTVSQPQPSSESNKGGSAAAGAAIGAAAGSWLFGIGAIPGAAIGGAIGWLFGD